VRNLIIVVLVSLLSLSLLAGLTGCENKVSQENLDKITLGMTKGEVEGILGAGTRQVVQGMSISGGGVAGGSGTSSLDTYTWKLGTREVSITFKDGKVMSKSF
jgi:hypothetical protein